MEIRTFNPATDISTTVCLYRACFAEPPWFEHFLPNEVVDDFMWIRGLDNSVFLVAVENEVVIAGAAGFPLQDKPEVLKLVNDPEAYYLAELFVQRNWRGSGLARQMIQRRFELIRQMGYRRAIVRTSVEQPAILALYSSFGFTEMNRQDVRSRKVIEGVEQMAPDTRVILVGTVPT